MDDEGILLFEGEYKNGIKYGKEYNSAGKLIFDGEYKNMDDVVKECESIPLSNYGDEISKEKPWNGKIYIYEHHTRFRCGGCCFGMPDFNNEYMEDSDIEKYKNIKDLIKFEGEYFNGEKNGKGKEYNIEGNLIYEGVYLNDKRKEIKKKGFLYFDDDGYYTLMFEGELLNGQKNGKGKEYDQRGNIIFEGEYLNGEKLNSKCKIFYDNDQLKFEGEFINGNPKGKFYNSNGIMIFEGEYSKGKEWNGKAKEYKDDKLIFEGEFINGKKIGKEYNSQGKLIFEGEYLEGKKWKGKFEEYNNEGKLIFKGELFEGKKWNGIIYNNNYNFEIEIKSGIYKLKDSNNKIKFINDSERRKKLNKSKPEYFFFYCSDIRYIIIEENGKGKEYEYNGKLIYEGKYLNWKYMKVNI